MLFRHTLTHFTATTLAAMYCDLDATEVDTANVDRMDSLRIDILAALHNLVGEDEAEELIDAERAKS